MAKIPNSKFQTNSKFKSLKSQKLSFLTFGIRYPVLFVICDFSILSHSVCVVEQLHSLRLFDAVLQYSHYVRSRNKRR